MVKMHSDYLAEDIENIKEMGDAWFYGYNVSLTDLSRYAKTIETLQYQFDKIAQRKELQPPTKEN